MTFTSGATSVACDVYADTTSVESVPLAETVGVTRSGAVVGGEGAGDYDIIRFQARVAAGDISAFRAFIKSTVRHRATAFSATPDANHDIGAGPGVVRVVRWWGDSLPVEQMLGGAYMVSVTLRAEVA